MTDGGPRPVFRDSTVSPWWMPSAGATVLGCDARGLDVTLGAVLLLPQLVDTLVPSTLTPDGVRLLALMVAARCVTKERIAE